METDLFVDNHCHLFNIIDIPLYATLEGTIDMGILKQLGYSILGGGALLSGVLESKLKENEEFLRFFERDTESNIKWLTKQIRNTVSSEMHVLLTPLVMDFDLVDQGAKSDLDNLNAEKQLVRLISAVKATSSDDPKIKICPFIGFDLRKLRTPDGLVKFQALWEKYSSDQAYSNFSDLQTGKVIGIKLYPPLGFNPYPLKSGYLSEYLAFYKWCCEKDIPLTVHCQEASYAIDNQSKTDKRTNPANWWHLLKDNPDLHNLRINFAHFGGEEGFDDMFESFNPFDSDGIDEATWTYDIVKMLKKYPNTYSDLSAFDYADEEACDNLQSLLKHENNQKFNQHGAYKISDKLLWGSDVPMIISGDAYRRGAESGAYAAYKYYFNKFQAIVSKQIQNGMTCNNPKRFLKLL